MRDASGCSLINGTVFITAIRLRYQHNTSSYALYFMSDAGPIATRARDQAQLLKKMREKEKSSQVGFRRELD